MNIIEAITYILKTALPRLQPKAGRGISITRAADGFTVSSIAGLPCLCAVSVRNSTGKDWTRGSTLKIEDVVSADSDSDDDPDTDADTAIYKLKVPKKSDTAPCAYAVLLEDIKDGYDGKAAVTGAVAVRLSDGVEGVHCADPDGSGRLSPATDGEILLPYADADKGWGVAVIGAGTAKKSTGPFDVLLKTEEGEEDEDGETETVYTIVCRDSSQGEDTEDAGIVYLGTKHVTASAASFDAMEGYVFVDVAVDDDDVLSASVKLEESLPELKDTSRRFVLALAKVYKKDDDWHIGMQRGRENIIISDRWS